MKSNILQMTPDSVFTLLLPGLPCSPPALATISWLLLTALWTSSTLAPAPSLATLWRMWARLSSSLHSAACHHHHNIVYDLINCFETPTVNLYLELSVVIYFMGFKVPTSSDKLSWALMSPIWVLPSLIYLIEPYLTLIWLYRTLFGPCYI